MCLLLYYCSDLCIVLWVLPILLTMCLFYDFEFIILLSVLSWTPPYALHSLWTDNFMCYQSVVIYIYVDITTKYLHNAAVIIWQIDSHEWPVTTINKLINFKSPETAMNTIINCVPDIRTWMIRNKLKINDDKTEFLVITSPYMKAPAGMELSVGQPSIKPSTSCRNLGAMFDNNQKMDIHISSVCRAHTSICVTLGPFDLTSLILQQHHSFTRLLHLG